jgi:hypothetical protein
MDPLLMTPFQWAEREVGVGGVFLHLPIQLHPPVLLKVDPLMLTPFQWTEREVGVVGVFLAYCWTLQSSAEEIVPVPSYAVVAEVVREESLWVEEDGVVVSDQMTLNSVSRQYQNPLTVVSQHQLLIEHTLGLGGEWVPCRQ